jgi:hypothetical protein
MAFVVYIAFLIITFGHDRVKIVHRYIGYMNVKLTCDAFMHIYKSRHRHRDDAKVGGCP